MHEEAKSGAPAPYSLPGSAESLHEPSSAEPFTVRVSVNIRFGGVLGVTWKNKMGSPRQRRLLP